MAVTQIVMNFLTGCWYTRGDRNNYYSVSEISKQAIHAQHVLYETPLVIKWLKLYEEHSVQCHLDWRHYRSFMYVSLWLNLYQMHYMRYL